MIAAKVMDVIASLPGCTGQAADAVSAYTQLKMEDAPRLLTTPKSEKMHHRNLKFQSQDVQIFGYVFDDTRAPNLGQTLKTQ